MRRQLGDQPVPDGLVALWQDAWPDALACWSRFTRLRPPLLCTTSAQAREEGLTGSFAMIRHVDQTVVIDLALLATLKLDDRPTEVLAHEVGHHVVAPASMLESGRVIGRMRVALPGQERHAPMLANIYADLLINDRLQRDEGLAIDHLYATLNAAGSARPSRLWTMYQRVYEILWALPTGTLAAGHDDRGGEGRARLEGDAQLGARLLRSYASQWADGAGRFAALCFPYLHADDEAMAPARPWGDAVGAGEGAGIPMGLAEDDPQAVVGAIHPSMDPALTGLGADDADGDTDGPAAPAEASTGPRGQGQRREPFEYGEVLRALGMDLTDHEVAVRYYRERAVPHLVPFPSVVRPTPGELFPEGHQPWSVGEPLEAVDWAQTVWTSPVVVPGVTTVQRVMGRDDTSPPRPVPLDLDLYIDSSGSMPNPQVALSYPALAGTVLVLSALRAGARVQATLWSGARQFQTTDGFTDDRDAILRVVLGHIGGGTAFPLHVLRDTYRDRTPDDPPVHILVISDSGISTIFNVDEEGTPGEEVQRMALRQARGGGTWVLELPGAWDIPPQWPDLGWRVERVSGLADLVGVARRFARTTYAASGRSGAAHG